MTGSKLTRRRALTIFAAGLAFPAAAADRRTERTEWSGNALGSDARILIDGADQRTVDDVLITALGEIERLEAIFSLYWPDSEIVRLNREKRLTGTSIDLRRVLRLSARIHNATGGHFDPTVQNLWSFHSSRQRSDARQGAPDASSIETAHYGTGFENIDVDGSTVTLRNGASITLNGIAQGYITDRVAMLFRALGWRHVLIDLGETRALGPKKKGASWRIGNRMDKREIALLRGALATSSSDGMRFRSDGMSHIINPATGKGARSGRSVTVFHRSAAVADALSTGLLLAEPAQTNQILSRVRGARAYWQTEGQVK